MSGAVVSRPHVSFRSIAPPAVWSRDLPAVPPFLAGTRAATLHSARRYYSSVAALSSRRCSRRPTVEQRARGIVREGPTWGGPPGTPPHVHAVIIAAFFTRSNDDGESPASPDPWPRLHA